MLSIKLFPFKGSVQQKLRHKLHHAKALFKEMIRQTLDLNYLKRQFTIYKNPSYICRQMYLIGRVVGTVPVLLQIVSMEFNRRRKLRPHKVTVR